MTSLSATKIAEALGVSGRAVRKRAKQQSWQPIGERTSGGGNVYDLNTLPLANDEKNDGLVGGCSARRLKRTPLFSARRREP